MKEPNIINILKENTLNSSMPQEGSVFLTFCMDVKARYALCADPTEIRIHSSENKIAVELFFPENKHGWTHSYHELSRCKNSHNELVVSHIGHTGTNDKVSKIKNYIII